MPSYVQDDPLLAAAFTESMADRAAERLAGKTLREVLPEHLVNVPTAKADDTVVEVAAEHGAGEKSADRGDEGWQALRRDHRVAPIGCGVEALLDAARASASVRRLTH